MWAYTLGERRAVTEFMHPPSEGLRLLASLEEAGAITQTSLILPPDTSYEQCEALATMFGQLHRTSAWLIGDLLNYIERVFGETYAQAAEATGLSKGTLMNYTSVCAHIPRSRRRATVPFSTHAEVAYLEPEDQDKWLSQAEANEWTKAELRAARVADNEQETPSQKETCICPTCGNAHTP